MKPRDRVDIPGVASSDANGEGNGPRTPFLQVWFRCCHAYGRLTKVPDGSRYEGRCPRCGARCSAGIGPGGTTRRSFEAR